MAANNVEPVIDKLEDLPEELRKQLSKSFMNGNGSLGVFVEKLEPILKNGSKNLDEIILAWWKEYNSEIIKRASTHTKLQKAIKEGLITSPSKAIFGWPDKKEK